MFTMEHNAGEAYSRQFHGASGTVDNSQITHSLVHLKTDHSHLINYQPLPELFLQLHRKENEFKESKEKQDIMGGTANHSGTRMQKV